MMTFSLLLMATGLKPSNDLIIKIARANNAFQGINNHT